MDKSFDISLRHEFVETDFVQAIINKEKWAQKKLYEDYYSKMFGICLRYAGTNDEALDILHDGFIKIFKNIDKYNPGTSLSAWMSRIMVNTAIDIYRKNIRRRTEDLDTAFHLSIKEANAIEQLTEQDILKAIQELTPVYRAVFNMYVIEGYAHKEIAAKLNISESTSRSNLVKARTKLKEKLTAIFSDAKKLRRI